MTIEKENQQPAAAPETLQKDQPPHPREESSQQKQGALQNNDEEIRRAKVAAIRDQLASGNYNISGKDVANKILEALKS